MKKWALVVASLALTVSAMGACADGGTNDGVVDDTPQGDAATDSGKSKTKPTAPTDSTGTDNTGDASSVTDSGVHDSGTKADSGKPVVDSGYTPPSVDCDTSSAGNYSKYLLEYVAASNPPACPCGAGQCCYATLGCVTK